ncbi:hypothetical protein DICSQDRAFT_62505 [Dichomitus squalens LYAD-421 SS1]|uniref:HAT C-terminal dimerisation domain-containing protein n=1 Tax=Dichomitus squalens (strain LYAD-421) TaxID=732165 RepID=R7SWR4_DICSQ|nr:uncharacterized protein DICSQDRAFT_62505 [Dichomitus squalens LYAD-421 SS1]EJF60609.1 hypothetical protein DICSQDRAFT_62505 [Dichomitus squalens LYAD-421 SS1]
MAAYTEARQTTNPVSLSRRRWYRKHFYDHPGYIDNDAKALHGDKVKVWCKPCFQHRVTKEQREDSLRGMPPIVCSLVWDLPSTAPHRWITATTPAMLVHLRDCDLTPDDVRQQAGQEHEREHLSPRREKGKARAQLPGPYITQPIPFPLAPGTVQSGPSLAMGVYRARAQTECCQKLGTVQCDGFNPKNRHHIIAFMLTIPDKNTRVYTVRTYDTSSEPKTAKNLLKMLREVLKLLRDEWQVSVIAVTSDCSGESRKARVEIVKELPHLIAPDCYAHQASYIELVVHDYFKNVQLNLPTHRPGDSPLSVIRGVLTRWTSIYLAYRRLLQLRTALMVFIEDRFYAPSRRDNRRIFESGTLESHAKTREMIEELKKPLLWHHLSRVKRHLEPLAIAANVTQANDCRLDQVLLTFGFIYNFFTSLTDLEDNPFHAAVCKSLEMRWAKADQDVFIAAVVLNPWIKMRPFRPNMQLFTEAAFHVVLTRLWKRFYPDEPVPTSLFTEIQEYFDSTGNFESLRTTMDAIESQARDRNTDPNPANVWRSFNHPDLPIPALNRIAIHILSICPNSANCERLFSTLGLIMTDLRSRLGLPTLMNLAELRLHLRDENIRNNIKVRLKRHFGDRAMVPLVQKSAESEAIAGCPSTERSTTHTGSQGGTPSQGAFCDLVRQHQCEDTDANDDTIFPSVIKIKLESLFDFSLSYWQKRRGESDMTATLDEELEVWNILDMDADGEPAMNDLGTIDGAGREQPDPFTSAVLGI